MIDLAKKLETGGAECIVICTNTMHRMANEVEESLSIPLLHIADATGKEIVSKGIKKVALLGTAFTMEHYFYKGRLNDEFGLNVIVPKEDERKIVHDIIYEELCLGVVKEESKELYLNIIDQLIERGAEAVILGCTEIGLLISQDNCSIPVFDTTRIHAEAAVEFALSD